MLTLLLVGWSLPGGAAFYTAVLLGMLVFPALVTAVTELMRRPVDLEREQHGRLVFHTLGRQLLREGFSLAALPYDALISLDAVIRTATRLLFTRRKLLEWRTASDAQRSVCTDLAGYYASMWILPAMAVVVLIALALFRR